MKSLERLNLRRILHVLTALSTAGILLCVFILFSDSLAYAQGAAVYKKAGIFRESPASFAESADSLKNTDVKAPAQKNENERRAVDFAALFKINKDVVGWLAAEGTVLDYPVVQGKDNSFYLDHLFTGQRNKLGSIFMDYRNRSDFSDKNTIIYGHNMKDGSMFSSLTKYETQQYYDSFPTMLLYTPGGSFTVEWFAGIVVDGKSESVPFSFKDKHDFQGYIDSLKKKSTFKTDTLVEADDRLITLCTCSHDFANARYALYGKLSK